MAQSSTNKQLMNLSLDELKKILSQEKQEVKKDYKELEKKMKVIEKIKKVREFGNKIKQGKVKPKKIKSKVVTKKIKTFEDYFEECIKNKKIPKDTPSYLDGFAKKYIIKGEPGVLPNQFFINKKPIIKEFLKNHRNTKVRFVLDVIMEKKEKLSKDSNNIIEVQDHSYFHSNTNTNLVSTNVKNIISESKTKIMQGINTYQNNGSDWYFKEISKLEIHINEFKPMRGSSYIPLPDWIMRKKAIVSIRNKDDKCFLWSILRSLHPREKNDSRFSDLKKYEFSLNTKGITFPMKVKDITKFENLNPDIPGINVFSNNDKNIIYPLREVKKECKNTIDLFLYEEDGKFHYSLIKNF